MKRLVITLLALLIATPIMAQGVPYIPRSHTDTIFVRKEKPYIRATHSYDLIHKAMVSLHFEQVYMAWSGPTSWDKIYRDEYYPCLRGRASNADRDKYIKRFEDQKLVTIAGSDTVYSWMKDVMWYAYKLCGKEFRTSLQHIGWDDNPVLQGDILYGYAGGKWLIVPVSQSISGYRLYNPVWRPWFKDPIDLEERMLPYCGIVDDDLMYDFRQENPFKTILTHNKQAPFIYVYDFDTVRDSMREWTVHDTMIHGWKAYGREEDKNPSRLEYGPLLPNANHPAARAARVQIFLRLYLAKLRIAKLLHPAPAWDEAKGDYIMNYSHDDNREWLSKIDPTNVSDSTISFDQYRKLLMDAPNEAYFNVLDKLTIPYEIEEYIKAKNWNGIRYIARSAQIYEIMRDFYIYKMFVRSPIQKELDLKLYKSDRRLSIALWSGMSSTQGHRHQFIGGIKNFFPFFERNDKRGHTHISNAYRKQDNIFTHRYYGRLASPTNTAGLVYAGHMDEYEFENYCSQVGKTTDQVWTDALHGPFMIVSSRTYARYGHAYFEKLAGHALKKVNVTGAVMESLSRVTVNPDPDLVKQLIDMDYFYYKKDASETRGSIAMKSVSSMRLASTEKFRDTEFDVVKLMRDPGSIQNLATNDTSTAYTKTVQFDHVFRDVAKGLAMDEKQFPGMSIRMVNYLPYHHTYPKKLYSFDMSFKWTQFKWTQEEVKSFSNGEPLIYPRQSELVAMTELIAESRGYEAPMVLLPEIRNYLTYPVIHGATLLEKDRLLNLEDPKGKAREVFDYIKLHFRPHRTRVHRFMPGAPNFVKAADFERTSKDEIREVGYDWFAKRFFAMPRTPRHIDFIEEMWRMKREGVVEKARSQYELQCIISERIPWLTMNPNLFMAYYRHIRELRDLFNELHGWLIVITPEGDHIRPPEMANGTGDGNMVWASCDKRNGMGDAIRASLGERPASQSDYMLAYYGLGARPKGYIAQAVSGGRLRKLSSEPGDFPKWLRWRPGVSSANHGPHMMFRFEWPFAWMRTRTGYPRMLRDPEQIVAMGGPMSNIQAASFIAKLMPGMTRFVNSEIIRDPIETYTRVWTKEGQFNHGIYYMLRGWMVEREYKSRTAAWLRYHMRTADQGKDNYFDSNASRSYIKYLVRKSAVLPRTNSTFVISDGIQTTVTRAKKGFASGKYVDDLYQGLTNVPTH